MREKRKEIERKKNRGMGHLVGRVIIIVMIAIIIIIPSIILIMVRIIIIVN